MNLKKEQIGATFYHPDGRALLLIDKAEYLGDVYKVAPNLFEETKGKQSKETEETKKQ